MNVSGNNEVIIDRNSDEYSNDYLNYSCYFFEDKCLFGSYPTQKQIEILEKNGVRIFVDLTEPVENLPEYTTNYLKINYQIKDRKVPEDYKKFSGFIIYLRNLVKKLKDSKIYIHCKGGHGRSGLVAACLLSFMNSLSSTKALELTREAHGTRKIMRDYWRKIGAPQTREQHGFVKKICGFFYFSKAYPYGRTSGLSIYSDHPVIIDGMGRFPTSEAAFQAFRNPTDNDYVERQKNAINAYRSKILGELYKNTKNSWEKDKNDILFNILKTKFEQHFIFKNNLENTYLKYLIFKNKDTDIGCDENNLGKNNLGVTLMKIKEEEFLKYYLNNC